MINELTISGFIFVCFSKLKFCFCVSRIVNRYENCMEIKFLFFYCTFIYWVVQVWKGFFLIPLKWLFIVDSLCICLILHNKQFMIYFVTSVFTSKKKKNGELCKWIQKIRYTICVNWICELEYESMNIW